MGKARFGGYKISCLLKNENLFGSDLDKTILLSEVSRKILVGMLSANGRGAYSNIEREKL